MPKDEIDVSVIMINTEKLETKVIVAVDVANFDAALALSDQLDPAQCRLKVGKELFTRCGPRVVEAIQSKGFDVFLDLKFHDIPNTVAQAVHAAADMGVWMVNVHTLGGVKMLEAAKQVLSKHNLPTLLIGVTILTSMGPDDVKALGFPTSIESITTNLAGLADLSGLDGIVCSAADIAFLKAALPSTGLKFVTPGIRFKDMNDDQTRIMTPEAALAAGSDYLVIGRPVTQAQSPINVVQSINSIYQ